MSHKCRNFTFELPFLGLSREVHGGRGRGSKDVSPVNVFVDLLRGTF